MADHKLDAEKMGFDRNPQRPPVREEGTELTANVKIAVFWVTVIAMIFGAWVYVRTRSGPPRSSPDGAALALKVERSDGRLSKRLVEVKVVPKARQEVRHIGGKIYSSEDAS